MSQTHSRFAFTLLACAAVLAALSLAPIASAGFEPCASTCSFKPPSAGCSCSNPYFNTNCAYYLQYGCSLYRAEQPQSAFPELAQADLSCTPPSAPAALPATSPNEAQAPAPAAD